MLGIAISNLVDSSTCTVCSIVVMALTYVMPVCNENSAIRAVLLAQCSKPRVVTMQKVITVAGDKA